jgi:hypothetical protein
VLRGHLAASYYSVPLVVLSKRYEKAKKLDTTCGSINNSSVFRRIIALILLGLCLPLVPAGPVKSGNRDELSNHQQFANSNPLDVARVFRVHENKPKLLLALSSEFAAPHFDVSRVWLLKQGKKTEQPTRILRIYELNRVLLI